jgi:hypothetical protein
LILPGLGLDYRLAETLRCPVVELEVDSGHGFLISRSTTQHIGTQWRDHCIRAFVRVSPLRGVLLVAARFWLERSESRVEDHVVTP